MKKYIFFIACYLLLAQVGLAQTTSEDLSILTPRSHNPSFSEPGGVIEVQLRDVENSSVKGWTAILRNDLSEWRATVKVATAGKIHHDTEDGIRLQVKVPADAPPELMELEIRHPSGKISRSARSVSIVSDFEKDFYIFHQSDEHTTRDEAVEPGGKSSTKWGNGSKEALQWLTPILNLVNPRFVLHTGDNTQIYNQANDWSGMEEAKLRMKRFVDGLSGYQVPTVFIPGNHDIGFSNYIDNNEWRKAYTHLIGQTAFSFTMGSFYVLTSEWTNTQYLDWARADYNASFNNPSVKYRLLASHFYDGLDGWTTIAQADKPADLLLVGHNHRTRTLQTTPYYVLSVGTSQNHQRAAFFDFKRTNQGWTSSQPAQHADEVNVHKLVGDHGAPTVSAVYSVENDGSAKSNSVSISNTLPHDFYNGRVRFLMKKGKYTVEGGDVISQYSYEKGKNTAVLVQVDIKKNSVTNVSINKK